MSNDDEHVAGPVAGIGHNAPQYRGVNKLYFKKSDVRKFFRGREAFSVRTDYIVFKIPYDEEMKVSLNRIKAIWNPDAKEWRVPIARFEQLKALVPKIEELSQVMWYDQINEVMRETEGDKRIWVELKDIDRYVEGEEVMVDGQMWIVTHIGRRKDHGERHVHPVYLQSVASRSIDPPAAEGF